ncbi:hypothetical protein PAXINDRAFT_157809 [Paxillus involutus ATCC 200175]|uniref:LysM domain-containing protein n=1 Tax=Paxillus involutus ATCC 200175 TaxID=664439 RepID=A0A0C9T253_PAXIN|nr:hypothetical protein PAXINDRAFT_157809 [Paxillus involutus ATCC 200175]
MFGLLSTFVLAAASMLQAEAALPANCSRNVTVAAGDTCDFISAKYNVSTSRNLRTFTYSYQLAAVNPGVIGQGCQNLYIGEILCLGLTGQDCQTTYVARFGQTCVDIADAYNISKSTILANNPNLEQNCANLYADEVLPYQTCNDCSALLIVERHALCQRWVAAHSEDQVARSADLTGEVDTPRR